MPEMRKSGEIWSASDEDAGRYDHSGVAYTQYIVYNARMVSFHFLKVGHMHKYLRKEHSGKSSVIPCLGFFDREQVAGTIRCGNDQAGGHHIRLPWDEFS